MATESSCSSSSTSQHEDDNKQNQLPNSNSNKSIDFVNLLKNDLIRGSEVQEHNFFSPVQVGSSSYFPNHNNEKNNSNSKSYSCFYGKSQYSSLRALKGHQNAHRTERAIQKQLIHQRYEDGSLGLGQLPFNPYLNYRITPFTPSPIEPFTPYPITPFTPYRPLGIRMKSLIQKSPYISPRIDHGALCLQDILNPNLVSLRKNIQGSNSGVASLGIGGATTSRIDDEIGRNNKNGDILKLGKSSTNIVASTSTMNDIDNSKANIEEELSDCESSTVDLSLKL
ncbi:uncharacterized protein LOC123892087 [Trifolium pratense]|uniref:uncharacterized protein LOC123892087 n=1 Tax=Trifolium pratense TaxID=57577 RepID=UPI001E691E88|nr:uncharacterized protein LOC123892087 [Trifolium pratense]